MKGFLLALTGLVFSASAFASNVQIELMPNPPIVLVGDASDPYGNLIKGPWFQMRFQVTNNELKPITLSALSVTVTNGAFTAIKNFALDQHEILPGESYVYREFYVGNLDKNSKSYIYDGNARLMGWMGTNNSPLERIDETLTFQTK